MESPTRPPMQKPVMAKRSTPAADIPNRIAASTWSTGMFANRHSGRIPVLSPVPR